MSRRRRLVTGVRSASTSTNGALRRRRRGLVPASQEIQGGSVIPTNQEEFTMDLLSSGPKANHFREGKYLHVSDLIYKCMRMIAISYRTDTKIIGEPIFDNLGVTFAIGDGIHDFVKSKAAASAPESTYAVWKCACGRTEHTGVFAEAKAVKCKTCLTACTVYDEVRIYNDEIMVVGSLDLTFMVDGGLYITEIKSIKKDDWDTLTRPLPIHLLQVLLYFWLAREAGMTVHRQVSVLYVTKGHVFGNPYKEFVINAEENMHRLDDLIEDAKALKEARAGGALPVKTCPNITSPQAKKCEMASLCFNM